MSLGVFENRQISYPRIDENRLIPEHLFGLGMALKRTGIVVLVAIALLAVGIAVLVMPNALENVAIVGVDSVLIRFLGLYGFLFLGIAALTTPFLAGVTLDFGAPFKRIHHTFAAVGIVLISLHPIFNSFQILSLRVFVPRFDSWTVFWALAGRPALYLFYIALGAAFLRIKIPRYWRVFHGLIYVVLFFGIVHANLLGEDFANLGIKLTFDALFASSIAGLGYKRYKNYRVRMKYRRFSKGQTSG